MGKGKSEKERKEKHTGSFISPHIGTTLTLNSKLCKKSTASGG